MCKEKLGIQIFSNGFMLGKFFSIIRSDGVHFCFDIESSKLIVVRTTF